MNITEDIEQIIDNPEPITLTIPEDYAGMRVDLALSQLMRGLSRTRISDWLKVGNILINSKVLKPKDKIFGGELVLVNPVLSDEDLAYTPEDIELDIIYEDEHILVINKPAGLIVHPGNGNWSGTLLNGLLFHYPELKNIPRAGIVHRLDKDTSGLMVVARSLLAQTRLVQDLQLRKVTRIYRAIVEGQPHKEGIINKNVGRDPSNRIKMAVLNIGGKEAITRFKVLQYFDKFSYIECKLETGRTHQIRVHMRSINHPIIGDSVYGQKKINYPENIVDAIESLNRQALHATKLSFNHPDSNELMQFKIALPYDMKYLLQELIHNENKSFDISDEEDEDENWEVYYTNE
ncbi:MAG: 23S rRNA pseudouridine(1911/1915/1917) synthase RluD [Neisseriaceae bacterium]